MSTKKIERRLRFIKRFSIYPCIIPSTVAEHSFYVIFYSWLIAEEFVKSGQSINMEILLEKALLHDMEEGLTGDIYKFFKTDIIQKKIEEISKKGLAPWIYKIWKTSRDESIEGQIVAFADEYEMLTYCLEEMKLGNKIMGNIFLTQHAKTIKQFRHPIFKKFLAEIKKEFKAG